MNESRAQKRTTNDALHKACVLSVLFKARLAFTLVYALFNINFGFFALQINHQSWAQVFTEIIAYFLFLFLFSRSDVMCLRNFVSHA